MNDLDECVRSKLAWSQLPLNIKQLLDNSQKEYYRYIFEFSIKNQLRYRGNLVRKIKNERYYYETLVQNSIQQLMLFPYHLADMIVKGLRITPFSYYKEVVGQIMDKEKSYDTLPNFTAADCLRLLGIGRNEYIELMNRSRGRGRSWKVTGSGGRNLLPPFPCIPPLQPWWRLELGYVLEEDIKMLNSKEHDLIDLLIDQGSQTLGTLDISIVHSLYKKGLVYIDVPITSVDRVRVPPLQGFVMNRVTGDYFETLLYKIFVSLDENTTVSDLSSVLQVDIESVKQAISLYCRLGFAQKIDIPIIQNLHISWQNLTPIKIVRPITPLTYNNSSQMNSLEMEPVLTDIPKTPSQEERVIIPGVYKDGSAEDRKGPRFGFLFDSTLIAYLMMGNLSPDLKNHAVTMFEVGKLCDESIDSFLEELDKIGLQDIEGEAKRYWTHALVLRSALRILSPLRPFDLVRCESLQSLDTATVSRLLNNKYKLLATMAPLSKEVKPPLGPPHTPPTLGPTPPETNSLWFKLYIYHITGYGPPTLLLTKGTVIKSLPRLFLGFSRLLVSSWYHEPVVLPTCNFLAINASLKYSPVMIQAYGVRDVAITKLISFPPSFDRDDKIWEHSALRRLYSHLDLEHSCGFISMVDLGVPDWGIDKTEKDVVLIKPSSLKSDKISHAIQISNNKKSNNDNSVNITGKIDSIDTCDFQNESVNLNKLNEKSLEKSSGDNLLQSPLESHFALTPVIQSKNHSPANGFTSIDCSTILCQELDQLEKLHMNDKFINNIINNDKNETLQFDTIENLLSPIEDNISMFPETTNSQNEDQKNKIIESCNSIQNKNIFNSKSHKKEKWTLLECHFGIPLFDEEINKNICEALVTKLSHTDSLEKLKKSNEILSGDLLTFISQCQSYFGENITIAKRGSLVPLPGKNLAFEGGKINLWTGK